MLLTLLPLAAVTLSTPDDTVVTTSPHSAQVRLADMLADANSIDAIYSKHDTFTFAIDRGGEPVDLVVTTSERGEVLGIVVRDRAAAAASLGSLSWLAEPMKQTTAITRLTVDEDGAVLMTTDAGARYMAIPGRGSGGNTAVEARWAADHDTTDDDFARDNDDDHINDS